jgi:adenosine deaminase
MRDLVTLPKAELHIHLEGSMRVDTVRDLADRRGVAPPSALDADGTWRFDDSGHFIEQYGAACNLLRDLDDFRRIGYELCEDLAAQGVRYAEVVFSPAQHAGRFGDWYGPIEAVLDGFDAGERDTGVIARLEPDVIRDLGYAQAEEVLHVALKYVGHGVVSLNCAGSERRPVAPYADIFRRAVEGGLHSTPHAGEWSGPPNVWDTLEHLRPERIGHGVRSADDPRLVERLAELAIPLEVCPSSNVATGVYASLDDHPFRRLREAGVVVTLNSDDPAMFGSWLSDEYLVARDVFGYGDTDLADIAAASVNASFADEDVKQEMLRDIGAWLADG